MTVGSQLAPRRKGVEHLGLHGAEYDEWVTPDGVITAEGVAEDPDHAYYAKGGGSDSDGGAVSRKWSLDAETVGEYDREAVVKILELLPQTRRTERGVPVLGWFYAAPLRPHILDWSDEFNLLQVVGVTGTGKTTFLKTLWEAFGMDPDPFDASDTPFTHMKHMASTNGVPVWIDEYKPADIRSDRLDELLRLLRASTKGRAVPKGRANLDEVMFYLRAPVVVSGEQKFSTSNPAVRRRSIMTNLSKMATEKGSSYRRAFAELTGKETYETSDGDLVYPDGYDLQEHARAYYQYVLEQSNDDLKELWNEAGEDTKEYLSRLGISLENTERQGAQTVLFGIRLYRRFGKSLDADLSTIPDKNDVLEAFEHIGSNIGKDGKRRGYADSFLELFAQAAANDYVNRTEAYRVIHSQKFGGEVLAFHMPTVYSAVKKYQRDYGLSDEYNIIGKNDYLDEFKDKIDRGGSYAEAVNHKTRFDDGAVKCVVIDHQYAAETLGSDFDLRSFGINTEDDMETADSSDDDDDNGSQPEHPQAVAVGEIDPSNQDLASTIAAVEFGQYDGKSSQEGTPAWTATLSDETGEAELVVWDEDNIPGYYNTKGVFEPDALQVKGAETGEYDGTLQLVVSDKTSIEPAQLGAGETTGESPDDEQGQLKESSEDNNVETEATADGGTVKENAESTPINGKVEKNILDYIRDQDDPAEHDSVVAAVAGMIGGVSPGKVEHRIEELKRSGDIYEPMSDHYRT
jgi:KaiC/GvpD/RAD55 family RecA-like ATPase